MSENNHGYKGSTFWQLIIAIPGSILAFTLLISLLAKTAGLGATSVAEAAVPAAVMENVKPIADVAVAKASDGPHVDKSGEEVVKAVCSACHAVGLMGSPKIGDKSQWGPRIAQGYETLIAHAKTGIRAMPARGGNADLTDGEIANAVAFMANQAGANFKAPTPSAAAKPSETTTPNATTTTATPIAATPVEDAKVATSVAAVATKTDQPEATKSVGKTDLIKTEAVAPVAATPPASKAKTGKEVVAGTCSMCHGTGLLGSPKIGDSAAWAPRIAQGKATLVQHALSGIRSMPARGGNAALTDEEVANAVGYMVGLAGKAPAEPATKPEPKSDAKVTKAESVKAVAAIPAAAAVADATTTEGSTLPPDEPVAEPVKPLKTGEQVFTGTCSMCHGTGLMGSPKFGDKEAWAPRIEQGYDTLVSHAIEGIRSMPAKGGNPKLADEEVARAVAYMANAGGADFKAK